MLKGGILYYTLFLSLISIVVISLILMRQLIFQSTYTNWCKSEEMDLNVQSAHLLYKQEPSMLYLTDSVNMDLFEDSLSNVTIIKRQWGIFDIITATTAWKKKSLSRSGLFGEVVDKNDPALFMPDRGLNLSLSGHSKLAGLVYAPAGIIRKGSVEGQPFIYEEVTDGIVRSSGKSLPLINSNLEGAINKVFTQVKPEISLSTIKVKDNQIIENNFDAASVTFYDEPNANLSYLTFKGNIIICAPGSIFVDYTTSLENVIIIARKIIVGEGFTGSFQAFALDSIYVGNNVRLNYPTVLCISGSDDNAISSNPVISLGNNTTISGCIILNSISERAKLIIPETSSITGQVYCKGDVDLKGDINGSLYCNYFSFVSGRSSYVNHLLNADININNLPNGFCGFCIGDTSSTRGLIKWID